jgi:mono/diheme cytochrome c family protein
MSAQHSIIVVASSLALAGGIFLSTGVLAQIVTPLVIPAPTQQATPKAAIDGAATPASYTQEQFARGASLYSKNCSTCHGPNLNDGEFGGAPLAGHDFKDRFFGTTVDSLFSFMSSAMPPDRPGGLTAQEYAALTAYVIGRNGVPAGAAELPSDPDALAKLSLP